MSDLTRGVLCALGAAVAWALVSLLARALSAKSSTVGLNGVRLAAGGALLLATSLATRGFAAVDRLSGRDLGLLGLSLLFGNAVGDTAFFASARRLGVARALALCMSYPIVAALLAALVLGEPLTAGLVAGTLLTSAGVALILLADRAGEVDRSDFRAGVGLALLVIVAWALSAVTVKPTLVHVDPVTAQGLRFVVAGTALLALLAASGTLRATWIGLAGTGGRLAAIAVLTALTGALFTAGLGYAGVGPTTALFATSPLWSVPLAWLLLGERPSPRVLLGAGLAVAGVAVIRL